MTRNARLLVIILLNKHFKVDNLTLINAGL